MKHILHTFRPEERLGELRLGLEEASTRNDGDGDGDGGNGSRSRGDAVESTTAAGGGGGGADGRHEELERPRENGSGRAAAEAEAERIKNIAHDSGPQPTDRRREDTLVDGEAGGADGGSKTWQSQNQASMWRSRWIFRDRRSPAMEPDELQVEVRVDLAALGVVHSHVGIITLAPGLAKRRWKMYV